MEGRGGGPPAAADTEAVLGRPLWPDSLEESLHRESGMMNRRSTAAEAKQ
jgi:hypothetical protein